MPVVPDDEYENLLDAGDMSRSPEDGTNDHTPESNYEYLPGSATTMVGQQLESFTQIRSNLQTKVLAEENKQTSVRVRR